MKKQGRDRQECQRGRGNEETHSDQRRGSVFIRKERRKGGHKRRGRGMQSRMHFNGARDSICYLL